MCGIICIVLKLGGAIRGPLLRIPGSSPVIIQSCPPTTTLCCVRTVSSTKHTTVCSILERRIWPPGALETGRLGVKVPKGIYLGFPPEGEAGREAEEGSSAAIL